MLKPAALYKGMLEQKMKEWYYTDDMMSDYMMTITKYIKM